jgi:hypothetical protein
MSADNGRPPTVDVEQLRRQITELERDVDAIAAERDDAELERDIAQRRLRELRRKAPSEDDTDTGLAEIPAYPVDALPQAAQTLVRDAARAGLPEALVAGAALAAMAAAIGPKSTLQVETGWVVRPILWVALLAPAGAGKSPAQELAFGPLRALDAKAQDDDCILLDDMTLEALARELHARDGAGALDLDELAVLLRGLGEYKRAGGGDRGRFLKLWTGAPWVYHRVGTGKQTNAVSLRVPSPTLVICGGLQPRLHELLGAEDDGMRPRWLPHLASMPERQSLGAITSGTWGGLLDLLASARDHDRLWRFDRAGRRAFERYRSAWKQRARGVETASVSAAQEKADVHLARVACVLCEADEAGQGGNVSGELVERAAAIVGFTLASWRALPAYGSFGLSRRDQVLDRGVVALLEWVERRPERKGTQREIQRARVGGARTPDEVRVLVDRYDETFPGCVTWESSSHGGRRTRVVNAPMRRKYLNVTTGDTEVHTPPNPHSRAIFDLAALGDSGDSGDNEEGR